MSLIEPTEPEIVAIASKLHVGEKLVAVIVNEWEGNMPEPGEEVEAEEVEPLEPEDLGGGNEPVEEVPMGEGNVAAEETPVFDDYEVQELGAGWYQVGDEKYHGKAALEEAGFTLEEE